MNEDMDTNDFSRASETFLTWLKSSGATISSRIQLADLRSSNAGRGIVAAEDLAEDEELFSIPRSSILTVETSSLPEAAQKELNDPWLSLIVAMVYEFLRGAESPWKAYFDILPEKFDSLMYWTDDDLEHLQGSAVVDKIGKEGADLTFTEQLIPLIAKYANTGTRSNEELLALCHRMGSTIMAYAFDLEKTSTTTTLTTDNKPSNKNGAEEQQQQQQQDGWELAEDEEQEEALLPKGMIPLADLLNANATLNNAKLFYQDSLVVMKTLRPIPSGHEIYNDYGPLPRADLLRRYGYITPKYALYDVVEIPSQLLKERAKKLLRLSANDLEERWNFAREQGILDEDAYDIARPNNNNDGNNNNNNNNHNEDEEQQIPPQFPEELCILLNLLATSKVEFEKLVRKDKLPKPELSIEAKRLLRTVLVYRYAMYAPDGESMTVDSAPGEGDRRRAMAVQVIEGEKFIIEEAVNAVNDVGPGALSGSKKRAADTLEDEAAAIRNPGKR